VTPCIVIGFDPNGTPLFLWPFGRCMIGPLAVVHFLGSKHANFNLGIWRRDIMGVIEAEDIREVLRRIAAAPIRLHPAALLRQPPSWAGTDNPFALLPHQSSPEIGARQTLERAAGDSRPILSSAMRSRLRTKERKLQKLAGYHYYQPTTEAEI